MPAFLCAKFKKPGHYAHQCKSKKPVAGQGNGQPSALAYSAQIQAVPQNPVLTQVSSASTRGSARVDVHTAATVVLDSAGVHKVPLDAFGPLGQGCVHCSWDDLVPLFRESLFTRESLMQISQVKYM